MLLPERVARGMLQQVQRRQCRRGLIAARRVVRDVLVEATPPVPRRARGIELLLQHPGPGDVPRAPVRIGVTHAKLDQVVEQLHGSDDEAAELGAVQHPARTRIDPERPRRVRGVAGPDVLCECVGRMDRCVQVPARTRQLVEQEVAAAEQPDLVGLGAAVEAARQARQTAAELPVSRAARRKRDVRPGPARGCRPVGELVVEHLPDCGDGAPVARVRVPSDHGVDERRVQESGIVLPVAAAQGVAVEDGVAQIDLARAALDEVPAEPQDVVVPETGLRPVPGQQPSLCIAFRAVPRQQWMQGCSGPQAARVPRREEAEP